MKILQIIYSLTSGGAERFVVDLCNKLSECQNDEIILLTICDSENQTCNHYLPNLKSSIRFANLHCKKGLTVKSVFAVLRFIGKEKPDVVHCHSNLLLLYLPMILNTKPKFFHTLHSIAPFCLTYKCLRKINQFFYNRIVQSITISQECSNSYRSLYGLHNDILINNGRSPMKTSGHIPSDLKKHANGLVFIHVGRFSTPKNQGRLFRVFGRLQKEGVPFDLFCIGNGYGKSQQDSINPQIHILGEKNNVEDYLSFSDFFVLSSDFEGLPISLLEAMSLGVVPICTPAGGIKDVIRDGENGYMSEGFEDEQLYDKIKQAILEFGKISKTALINEFQEKYSMDVCAEKYHDTYKMLKK